MGDNEVLNYVTLLSTIETSSCFHMATESKVKISASGAKASFLCEHYGLWCVPWDIFGLFVVFSMAGPITPPVGYLFILGFISFFLFLISILLVFSTSLSTNCVLLYTSTYAYKCMVVTCVDGWLQSPHTSFRLRIKD